MFSKRNQESKKATLNIMMYSADEVEKLVMDAISKAVLDDCKSDDEKAGVFCYGHINSWS